MKPQNGRTFRGIWHLALYCITRSWWESVPIDETKPLVTTNNIHFVHDRRTLWFIAKTSHHGKHTGEKTITGTGLRQTTLWLQMCLQSLWNRPVHQIKQLLLSVCSIEFLPFKATLSQDCLNLLELHKVLQIQGFSFFVVVFWGFLFVCFNLYFFPHAIT